MTDSKKLLPCPFCGESKYIKVTYQDSMHNASIKDGDKFWGVFCMEGCCASISSVYQTKEEAINAWNTRHTKTTPSVSELQKIVRETKKIGMVHHYYIDDDWSLLIAKAIHDFLNKKEG